MTVLFFENWEGGTNGAACTPGNTSFSAQHNFTFSNAHVISGQGTLGGHFNITGGSGGYAQAQASFTASNAIFCTVDLRIASAPSVTTPLMVAKNGTTVLGQLVVTSDQRLALKNSSFTVIGQSAASLVPLNSDGRVEWMIDSVADQQRVRYFATPTASTATYDSGMVSTTAVGQIDTIALGATSPATFEAFLGDFTVDDTAWMSFGGGGGGGGTVAHRASTSAQTSTGGTIAVTVPSTVATGDCMVLEFVSGNNSGFTQADPAGWTRAGIDQTSSSCKVNIWTRVATGTDHGTTVTVTSSGGTGTNFRNLHLNAYSGAVFGNMASRSMSSASTAHQTPSVATVSANAWIHAGLADRNSPGSTSFTLPGLLTNRSEQEITTGSSAVSSITASDDTVGSGTPSTYSITGTLNTVNAVTWAVVLEPTGTTVPVQVTAPSDVTSEPYRPLALTPSATGAVTSWSWTQLSPPAPDIVTGSPVDANGTLHLVLPPALAETTFTMRVIGHVTGVTPDASDDLVITVFPATRRFVKPDGTEVPLRIMRVI